MNINFNSNATPLRGLNSRESYTYNQDIPLKATLRQIVSLQHRLNKNGYKTDVIIAINPNRKGVKV